MAPNIEIREEQPGDAAVIRTINDRAFAGPGEAQLVDALRASDAVTLSLVATVDGAVVGHILFSPVVIHHGERVVDAVGLGPMSVLPESQRLGIGTALVTTGLQILAAEGHRIVVVLGHPEYYPRFGFDRADRFGIRWEQPCPPEAFMVRELVRAHSTTAQASCAIGRSSRRSEELRFFPRSPADAAILAAMSVLRAVSLLVAGLALGCGGGSAGSADTGVGSSDAGPSDGDTSDEDTTTSASATTGDDGVDATSGGENSGSSSADTSASTGDAERPPTIGLVQYDADAHFGDWDFNTASLTDWAEAAIAEGATILVFPEGSSWGYASATETWCSPGVSDYAEFSCRDVSTVAEPLPGGPTTDYWAAFAAQHDVIVIFHALEVDGSDFYNAIGVVDPNGFVTRYRKRTLYYIDQAYATPGSESVVIDIPGGRFGLMICIDGTYDDGYYDEYAAQDVDGIIISMDWDDDPNGPAAAIDWFRDRAANNDVRIYAADVSTWDGTALYLPGDVPRVRNGLPEIAIDVDGISVHELPSAELARAFADHPAERGRGEEHDQAVDRRRDRHRAVVQQRRAAAIAIASVPLWMPISMPIAIACRSAMPSRRGTK